MLSQLSVKAYPVLKRNGAELLRQFSLEFTLDRHYPKLELLARMAKGNPMVFPTAALAGRARETLWLPEPSQPTVVIFELRSAGKTLSKVSLEISPARQWSVHLLHQSHFDYGYTTLHPDVFRLQLSNFDALLDYFEDSRGKAPDRQFRWNVECTFPLLKYFEARPASYRQNLLRASREGLLEVMAMPFTMHSEGCNTQGLVRSLRPVKHLRDMGFDIQTAVQTDVPGCSAFLPKLLNNIGIRHFAMAPNNFRAPFNDSSLKKLPRPFLWQGPYGGELLTWTTDLYDHVYQEGNILGFLENVKTVEAQMGPRLADLEGSGYTWRNLGLRIQGSYSDNGRPAPQIAQIAAAWNELYAAPQIRMSTFHQFFVDLEEETKRHQKKIKAFWPDWWAEGIGSMAREFAMHRRSQEKAVFSETALTLASQGKITPECRKELADLWEKTLLCDEHTWGAASPEDNTESGPLSGELQAGFKKSFFFQGALAAERAENAGRAFWAAASPKSKSPTVVVQNALSWPRSGIVELVRDELLTLLPGIENWKFIDEKSGRVLISQQITRNNVTTIHLFAEDIPAFGQRTIRVEPGPKDEPSPKVSFMHRDIHRGRLANTRSNLELSHLNGAFLRWTESETGQVLMDDTSPYLFGEVIHQKLSRRHFYFVHQEITAMHREENAALDELEEGPLFSRLALHSQCGPTKIRREVLLHHTTNRLDLTTTLQKPSTLDPEAVFIALPLKIAGAQCILGTNGGPMIPGQNQIPGSSSDWFVLRDHLDVAGPKGGVMIALPDTPMIQIGDISKPSPRGTGADSSELFAYALNNLWPTNFAASQGGEFSVRASLMNYGHAYDAAWSRRRALECVSPLRAFLLGSTVNSKPTAKDEKSSMEIETSNNVIVSAQLVNGGMGMMLEEIGGKAGNVDLHFAGSNITRIVLTNAVGETVREIPIRKKSVRIPMDPNGLQFMSIETMRTRI